MEAMCAVVMLGIKSLPTTGLVWVREYIPSVHDTMTLNGSIITNIYMHMCSFMCTTSHHTDIDECTQGVRGCNQYCTNTNGSYVCSCYVGYQISSDNRTCVGKKIYIMSVHDTMTLYH